MTALGQHRCHHRLLAVITAVTGDTGELAQPRSAAVGSHHQARVQSCAGEPQGRAIALDQQILDGVGPEHLERVEARHAMLQGALHGSVLDDVAERFGADLRGVEMHAAAPGRVPHVHLAEYAHAIARQCVPHVDAAENKLRSRGNGAHPQLPVLAHRRQWLAGLDHRHAQAGLGERAREGRTDEASSGYGDIVVHAPRPRVRRLWRPASPMAWAPK